MGLMDFLGLDTRDIQEFTRGFVGSKVEAMEAEANRKAGLKNEEDKYGGSSFSALFSNFMDKLTVDFLEKYNDKLENKIDEYEINNKSKQK